MSRLTSKAIHLSVFEKRQFKNLSPVDGVFVVCWLKAFIKKKNLILIVNEFLIKEIWIVSFNQNSFPTATASPYLCI